MLRSYFLEAKYELLKAWRMPAFAIPTLAFPLFFYGLFGLTFSARGGPGGLHMASYLIATYGAFGVMGPSLFNFGVGVAAERGQGWLLLKRATPMPPLAYFLGKIATAMVFGAIVLFMMWGMGSVFGGVRFAAAEILKLFAVIVFGAIPFSALGLLIGFVAGPNSAPAIVNLIYLPTSFLSGMWIPIMMLPKFLQKLAQFLPAYHFAQLATGSIGQSQGGNPLFHALVLAGFTLVCLGLARWAYLRDDGRTFG